jgi:hypothetical protein
VARDGLSLNHLAISNLRCGVVNNGSGLLPSTYERAQGVTEGYVLSMGPPLLCGFRISFQTHASRTASAIRALSSPPGAEQASDATSPALGAPSPGGIPSRHLVLALWIEVCRSTLTFPTHLDPTV